MLEILSKCWRYGFLTMTLLLVLDISWYQAWWRDARLRRMEECLTVAWPTSASGAPNTTTCWPSRTRKTFWGREIWCLISLRASTSWSRTLMEGRTRILGPRKISSCAWKPWRWSFTFKMNPFKNKHYFWIFLLKTNIISKYVNETYYYLQDLDLDCVIELTQAPGLSAYNRAERKMYHLSKEQG